MSTIHIELQEALGHARYVATVEGKDGEAELTFARARPDLVIADHTFAPDSLRGTGAAAALVERLVTDARADQFKIIAQCPYIKAQYQKHPDWADVMRTD